MKKSKLVILCLSALASLGGLSGCGNEETPTPVNLMFGEVYQTTTINPTNRNSHFYYADPLGNSGLGGYATPLSTLSSLVSNEQSFIVFVLGSSTCACFQDFRDETLYPYMEKHNLRVYLIRHEEFAKSGAETYGLNVYDADDNIAIFNEGTLAYQHILKDGDSFHDDSATFTTWMNARITYPKILYVYDYQLDDLYLGKVNGKADQISEFTIYFGRSSCGDCSYLDENYLKEYFASFEEPTVLYAIDLDAEGIRKYQGYEPNSSGNESEQTAYKQYNDWKVEHGLSSDEGNNEKGYLTGVVPTFFHIACSDSMSKIEAIDGAAVYDNDVITLGDNNQGTVSSSYYTEDRLDKEELDYLRESSLATKVLEGISILEEDLNIKTTSTTPTASWKHEKAAVYHDPILKAFLDYYLGSNK